MRELSLNILDIAENSVRAEARRIDIEISLDGGLLAIEITDDGRGMDKKLLATVTDPFTTTRTTRKVGMGLPFFKQAAEITGGTFKVQSEVGKGTVVRGEFMLNSIDRAPLGNLGATVAALIAMSGDIRFVFKFRNQGDQFVFDTDELKRELGGLPPDTPEVLAFVKEMINDNLYELSGGAAL